MCVFFSIVVYESQGKYISRFLFQGNSVSDTEKNNESKINISFHVFRVMGIPEIYIGIKKYTDKIKVKVIKMLPGDSLF